MADFEVFEAGDFVLQSGETLPRAKLAFKTHGTLNAARDNAIVYPTWYSGRHTDNEWLIGPSMALSPETWFIIVPDMLGNGVSSSPSNTPAPCDRARFPRTTLYDNVRLQHRLVAEHFGIERLKLVLGWSMGAQQTYQWAAQYPDMVERILPFCGSARTARHNYVFLDSLKAALTADQAFRAGDYTEPPRAGLRAFGRVYAGWMFSQAFYRAELDMKALGAPSLEGFLGGFIDGVFGVHDANNLLAMLWTWQHGDISAQAPYGGDYAAALAAITAKAIVMPCQTDLYFPPEDSAFEVANMRHAELRPIPSIWGHMAGFGGNPEDAAFIDAAVRDLLGR